MPSYKTYFILFVVKTWNKKNIVNLVDFFSIKLHNGTRFLSHLLRHLRTRFNHQNNFSKSPFLSRSMWMFSNIYIYIYEINYFINVMVIQSNVLRMILGWDISFVYLNPECTLQGTKKVPKNKLKNAWN